MTLEQAVATVEYKIATDSERFDAGTALKIQIHNQWPAERELRDALSRKYPFLTLRYDHQPNDCLLLIVENKPAYGR